MALEWEDRIPMLSVNPDAATREDIARMAAELMDVCQKQAALKAALIGLKRGDCWCGMAIGNPNYQDHDDSCYEARAALGEKISGPEAD